MRGREECVGQLVRKRKGRGVETTRGKASETHDPQDDGLRIDDLTDLGSDLTFDGVAFLLPVR